MKEANNNIPQHWKIVELKSIAESIQYGYTESSSKEKIGPKFLRITDIQDNKVEWDTVPYCKIDKESKKKYLLKDGDLLFARTGATVGKSFLIKGNIPETIFASYLIRVRVNQELNDNFLSYFFHSLDYWSQITEGQVGIGQPNVNGTKLGNLNIPLPPLPEQVAIVNKIEELFSELENGKEQLLTAQRQLKVYRQSLLKAAFDGRLTNENVKDGELPEGWTLRTIGEIFDVFIGSTPKRNNPEYWGGNINWVSSGEIAFCTITNTKEKITKLGLEKTSCQIHPIGTVIIAMIGEGKTRGQAAILKIEATHNQNTAAIRVDNSIYKSELLYYYLVLKYEENRRIGSGNNQKALNKDRVKSIRIPLPPLPAQQAIVEILESKLTVCDKLEETISHSLEQTETLRQSILKKAFEGKLV